MLLLSQLFCFFLQVHTTKSGRSCMMWTEARRVHDANKWALSNEGHNYCRYDRHYTWHSFTNKRLEAKLALGQAGIDHIVQLPHITFGIKWVRRVGQGPILLWYVSGMVLGHPHLHASIVKLQSKSIWCSNPNFSLNLRFSEIFKVKISPPLE